MLQELLNVRENDTLPDLCLRFGNFLGYGGPVPQHALVHAIHDPLYASNLITSRHTPGFLIPLLNQPFAADFTSPEADQEISGKELVQKAVKAFINWGKAGFSIVEDTVLKTREDACLACPNLMQPKKLLQKLVSSKKSGTEIGKRTGNRVCKLCGCTIGRKIRLQSESCPDAHPHLTGQTRWQEPTIRESDPQDSELH